MKFAGRLEFVCLGNICRSPFAAGAAVAYGVDRDRVGSSGLWASDGAPCPPEAVRAAKRYGVDLAPHRARRVKTDLLGKATLVAAMEEEQVRRLRPLLPPAWRGNLCLLGGYLAGERSEIADPYGLGEQAYEESYLAIFTAVEGLVRKVVADPKKQADR